MSLVWQTEVRNNDVAALSVYVHGSGAESEFETNDLKNVVAGSKGAGKSMLLHKKYQRLVTQKGRDPNVVFLPRTGDKLELMGRLVFSYSHSDLRHRQATLDSSVWWELLWSVAMATVVLFNAREKRPVCGVWALVGLESGVEWEPAPEDRAPLSVHRVLQAMLEARKSSEELAAYLAILRPLLGNLEKSFILFMDNIDEAFDRTPSNLDDNEGPGSNSAEFGEDSQNDDASIDTLGSEVSLTAQVGLLAAIRVLQGCKRLDIYTALRVEAIDKRIAERAQTAQQERALCIELDCPREFARAIFEANMKATPDEHCARPDEQTNPYLRFAGIDRMPMTDGSSGHEDLFDYFYRHTLGRPRDLMQLGQMLMAIVPRERNFSTVRQATERAAGACFKNYQSHMLPYWDSRYELAFCEFNSDLLSENEVIWISQKMKESEGITNAISYFVNRGLIGTLDSHNRTEARIRFRPPSRYVGAKKVNVKQSPYYFLHPVIVSAVRQANGRFMQEQTTVVSPTGLFTRPRHDRVLKVTGSEFTGLLVEFDGRSVRRLGSETNVAAPLFAALAMAAWHSRSCAIPFALFQVELDNLYRSGICRARTGGETLPDLIKAWDASERDVALLEFAGEIDDIWRDHFNRFNGTVPHTPWIPMLSWASGEFRFSLCEAANIDCGDLSEEIKRRCGASYVNVFVSDAREERSAA